MKITAFNLLALALPLTAAAKASTFAEDVKFLSAHTSVIVLHDKASTAEVAVSPDWQGRVLTSTAKGDSGLSYGWLNHELISSENSSRI